MKKEIKWFGLTQYQEEAAYLREMHKHGWKISEIRFPCTYLFEECEPEDVVYQLDYNQEGINNKAEYKQMFTDCGWKYLFDFVGYSYFCKPAAETEGDEDIFCDDESRLEMMKRIFRGRLLPLLLVLFPALWLQLITFRGAQDRGAVGTIVTVLIVSEVIAYAAVFGWFGLEYWKMLKNMKE